MEKKENNQSIAIKASYFSIIGNLCLAIIKAVAGIFGNSFALIADAIESTGDVISSFITMLGIKYSNKPPDENHPYGHGKVEPLVTFIIVGFLIFAAAIIAIESVHNIQNPKQMPKPFTLIVLGAIIIIKEVFYRTISKKSEKTNSTSLKADAWHHRSDAFTSLAAFIGISIALIMGEGYESADDWAALFASGIILYNSYKIFRPALGEIMDEDIHTNMIYFVRRTSLLVEGVKATEKCFVRKSGMWYYVDLHAEVDANITVEEGHEIARKLKAKLMQKNENIAGVLVHIEPFKGKK